jgi:hypothetical protein
MEQKLQLCRVFVPLPALVCFIVPGWFRFLFRLSRVLPPVLLASSLQDAEIELLSIWIAEIPREERQ